MREIKALDHAPDGDDDDNDSLNRQKRDSKRVCVCVCVCVCGIVLFCLPSLLHGLISRWQVYLSSERPAARHLHLWH